MESLLGRRSFLASAGVGVLGTQLNRSPEALAHSGAEAGQKIKIVAVACSLRAGKTTAQGLRYVLEAAKAVDPERIETVLIDLGGRHIPLEPVVNLPLPPGERDDFPAVAEQLVDPTVRAIIVGSPVYYASMSALCKSFIDRLGQLRREFALSGRLAGALAVGGARNGGQEFVIQSITTALMCHEMLIVGDGRPTGHFGAALWNPGTDDISGDEVGIKKAQNLGRHVAQMVLRLR